MCHNQRDLNAKLPQWLLYATQTVLVVAALQTCTVARGDFEERFEGAKPTWRFAEGDSTPQIVRHERLFRGAHAGIGCEFLQLNAGHGTCAYFTHTIPSAPVIEELAFNLWVKSDRPGIQLLVRVVCPRTPDSRTGKPLTSFLRGEFYKRVGVWQNLELRGLPRLLERHSWVLRQQFGERVDVRGAYVDQVVINGYGGANTTNLWIDDLEVHGNIEMDSKGNGTQQVARHFDLTGFKRTGTTSNDSAEPASNRNTSPVRQHGSLLYAGEKPLLPRIVRHRGESFEWLQSLGFNVVQLSSPPTAAMIQEAEQANVWILSPPHDLTNETLTTKQLRRTLAWELGNELTNRNIERAAETSAAIQRLSSDVRPLVVGDVYEAEAEFAALTDWLCLESNVAPGRGSFRDFYTDISQRNRASKPGVPLWVSLSNTGFTLATAESRPQSRRPDNAVYESNVACRAALFAAITAGARGFHLPSTARLDGRLPAIRQQADQLRELNRELILLEPWLVSGKGAELQEALDPAWHVTALPTASSRLLIAVHHDYAATISDPAARIHLPRELTLVDGGSLTNTQAYQITPTTLRCAPTRRRAGGITIHIDKPDPVVLVVLTQDPQVVNYLARSFNASP